MRKCELLAMSVEERMLTKEVLMVLVIFILIYSALCNLISCYLGVYLQHSSRSLQKSWFITLNTSPPAEYQW